MTLNKINKNMIDPNFVQEVQDTTNKIGNLSELKTTNKTDIVKSVNEVTSQLADTVPVLNNGKLILPSDFPKLPFNILKNKYGEFHSDATPYNQFNWSDSTKIYIKYNGSGTDGLSHNSPITLAKFRVNFNSGVYGVNKKFTLLITDYLYFYNATANSLVVDIDADILIKSASVSGMSWLGRCKIPSTATQTSAWISDGSIYKTIQTTTHTILDVVNLASLDGLGMPDLYTKASTLAECQTTKGTFYQSSADVYCNPLSTHAIGDVILVVGTSMLSLNSNFARVTMFENIGFLPSTYTTGTINNLGASIYFFGCKFHNPTVNGLYLSGQYKCYSFDCVVGYPTLDGFNYHTSNVNSLAVEVNCKSYMAGKYKNSAETATHSNNGSTAHEGMYVLRVGCEYADCEGPIVADVDNCFSISIGCEASGILPTTTTSTRAAFYFYDSAETTESTAKPKYVLECKGFGKNVEIGVSGTAKTYVKNFVGNQNIVGNVQKEVSGW